MPLTIAVAKPDEFVIAKLTHVPSKRRAKLYAKNGKTAEAWSSYKLLSKADFEYLKSVHAPKPESDDDEED